jgi:glycosyltransferase involved in cell wall biosynthesis
MSGSPAAQLTDPVSEEAKLRRMEAAGTQLRAPRVTVVLPVHNTAPYLRECLDSLDAQDLPPEEIEIVAVDDGSTDGCGEILDAYAAGRENVTVVHQPNSGWPGQPRNRGIDLAQGTYVFFLDSDDALGPEALRRSCDFADDHESDIVAPRMLRLTPPRGSGGLWSTTLVDAPLETILKTLSPQKLFRRSFLDEHGLRFPEGKVRLEDGIFVTRAYLLARRVSIYADYDCYLKRRRDEGKNISHTAIPPGGYVGSLMTISDTIRELCRDRELADELVLGIYQRKGLHRLRAERFLTYKQERRRRWVNSIARLAETHVPRELQRRLPVKKRLLSEFARRRDVEGVAAVSAAMDSGRPIVAVRTLPGLVLVVGGRARRDRRIEDVVDADERGLVVESSVAFALRRAVRKARRLASRGAKPVRRLAGSA